MLPIELYQQCQYSFRTGPQQLRFRGLDGDGGLVGVGTGAAESIAQEATRHSYPRMHAKTHPFSIIITKINDEINSEEPYIRDINRNLVIVSGFLQLPRKQDAFWQFVNFHRTSWYKLAEIVFLRIDGGFLLWYNLFVMRTYLMTDG